MAVKFFLAAGYTLVDSLDLMDIFNYFVKEKGYVVGPVDKEGHRPITLKLLIQGETTEALNQNQENLKWKLEQAELAYGPNGVGQPVILHCKLGTSETWTYWTVIGGKVEFTENEGIPERQMDASVELLCLQDATSDPVPLPATPATDSMHPVFVDSVRGDCSALGQLIITDTGTEPIGRLYVARRGHRNLVRSGFKPFYPATGSIALTTDWQDVASFDSPQGPFDSGIFDIIASITDTSRALGPVKDLDGKLQPTGGLQGGLYEYEITSLDAFGQESATSNLFAVTVPGGSPLIQDANPDPASVNWSGPQFLGGSCSGVGSFGVDRPGLCQSTSRGLHIRVQSDGWILSNLIESPLLNTSLPLGNTGPTNKKPPKVGELGYAYTLLARGFPTPQTRQLSFQYDIVLDSLSIAGNGSPVFFPQLAPFGLMRSPFGWAFYCSSASSSEDIEALVNDWKSGKLLYTLFDSGHFLNSSFLAVTNTVRIDIDWRDGPLVGSLFINNVKVATLVAEHSSAPATDVSLGIVVTMSVSEKLPVKQPSPDESAWSYTKVDQGSTSGSESSSSTDSSSANTSTSSSKSTTDSDNSNDTSGGSGGSTHSDSGSGSDNDSSNDSTNHTDSGGHNHTDATAVSVGPDGTNTSGGGGDSDDTSTGDSHSHSDSSGTSSSGSSDHGSSNGSSNSHTTSKNHSESNSDSSSSGTETSKSQNKSESSSETTNEAAFLDIPKEGLSRKVIYQGRFSTKTKSKSSSSSSSTSESANTSTSDSRSETSGHGATDGSSSSGSDSGSSSDSSNPSSSSGFSDSNSTNHSSGSSASSGQTADGATVSSNDNDNSSHSFNHGTNSSDSHSHSHSGGGSHSGSSSNNHSRDTSHSLTDSHSSSSSTSTSTSSSTETSSSSSESKQDVYQIRPLVDTILPNGNNGVSQAGAYFSKVSVTDGLPGAGGSVLLNWTPDPNAYNQRVWRILNTGVSGTENHWQYKSLGAADKQYLDTDPVGWTNGTPPDTNNGPQTALVRIGYSATPADPLKTTVPVRAGGNGVPTYVKIASPVLPPGPRPEPESDSPGPFHIVIQAKTDALTLPQSPHLTVNGSWLLPQSESQFVATPKAALNQPVRIKLDHRRDRRNSARAFSLVDGSELATLDAKGELTLAPGGNYIIILAEDQNGAANPNIRFTVQVVYTPRTTFLFGLG